MRKSVLESDCNHKPHICFVSESVATYALLTGRGNATGGAELQQILIASALRKMGYCVTFLIPDCGQPVEITTPQGFRVIKTRKHFGKARSSYLYLGDMFRMFRALDNASADIYYQRGHGVISGITALYCRIKRKPFVFSLPHDRNVDGTGRLQVNRVLRFLYDYGLTHATKVVVQSSQQQKLLKEKVGVGGVLIRSAFDPPVARVDSLRRYVLWVSNFREMKRPRMFLDLASNLPQYRFLMIGGPSVEEISSYDEMIREAKSISNLKLMGAIPYRDVGQYFDQAIVYVNTSSTEGFPNTYLQAWCRGVPVIGTFDPDGVISENGLGRSCSTLEELIMAVTELVDDQTLRSSIGQRAIGYVYKHHSITTISAAYDELFTSIVNTSHPN